MKKCPVCGGLMPDDTKFCTACGESLTDVPSLPEEQEAVPVPAPAPVTAPSPAPVIPEPVKEEVREEVEEEPAPKKEKKERSPELTLSPNDKKRSRYELLSSGQTLGVLILLCIPVVGLILSVIWALGGCRKLQKKYIARAWIMLVVITLIIALILGIAAYFVGKSMVRKFSAALGVNRADFADALGDCFRGNFAPMEEMLKGASSNGTVSDGANALLGIFG